MTTRYVCVHCGNRFTLEESEAPRCPSCMRKGGLEKLAEATTRRPRRGLAIGVALAVVGVLAGGYALYASYAPITVEGDPPLEPLAQNETRAYMANAGVESTRHSDILEESDAAERLAERISGGSPDEKARSLARHLGARREAGAYELFSLALPRPEELRTHADVLAALERDGGRAHLFPLEVATLAAAALRSEGVPAMVAEVWSYPEERAPLDPSGQLGYYAIAVYADEPGEGTPVVVDVYGGRDAAPSPEGFRVLTDVQVVSAALVARAQNLLHVAANGGQALGVVESALKLDPRSPSARVTRGLVLVAAQGFEEAKRELESAVSIRGDAPRRVALSTIAMIERDLDRAEREVRAAIEERPGYAVAHIRLATLQLEAGESALALESLEEAERLEARVPELPLLFAQYHAMRGEHDQARARARQAIESFPSSWQTQLVAAQIFRSTGDDDAMRRAIQAALAAVPDARRERVREQIAQSMGEDALEPPSGDAQAEASEEAETGAAGLELELGAAGEAPVPSAGALELGAGAGGATEGQGGPVIMMGDPSEYRLLGPNDRLELRLGE